MNTNFSAKKDFILEIVKNEGPVLPVVIAKKVELDITFASAMLSELVDNKILKLTNVKYGGSPFYYVSGQEEKLVELIKYLNEKDVETVKTLEESGVLRDRDLNTLQRFGLRQVKDFAKEIKVRVNDSTDLFWKWFLVNDEDTKLKINEYFERVKPSEGDFKPSETKNIDDKPPHPSELNQNIDLNSFREVQTELVRNEKELVKETLEQEANEVVQEIPVSKNSLKEETKDPLGKFFLENSIDVLDQKVLRKNKEINYLVGLNTDVGKGVFFLKFKDKKRINEADIGLALHEAGKLPLVFLSTGEVSKRAKELLGTEFKGVIFKKI